MPILNYTTKIAPEKTVSEIQARLVKNGARQMNFDYNEDGILRALTFRMDLDDVPIYFSLAPDFEWVLRAMRREGCKVLIVDYIQLMGASGKNQNREQEIGEISRGLKAIAKELQVPVIALSQLSRAVETRGGSKRPQLSDLRESGSIEQDAYCVMFLYRPEYYGVLTDNEGNDTKGAAMLIVAKNRNGALDDLWFKFNGPTTEFTDFKTTSNNQAIPAGSFPDESADLPF